MKCNAWHFFTLMMLLIIPLCNKGYAEESTFEIKAKNENKSNKKAIIDLLNKQEYIYLNKLFRLPPPAANPEKSNTNEVEMFEEIKNKDLNILLRIEDIKAQMNGFFHKGQIQGIRKLLYIMIFTDDDTAANSFNQIRYQTIILASDNILKLTILQEGIYEGTHISERTEKMFRQLINDINKPKYTNESVLKNQRL